MIQKKATNSAAANVDMSQIVQVLLDAGWTPDGETDARTVRIPTQASPLFGRTGGELATLGGRQRFRKGARRVTVGPSTTFFWTFGPQPNAKHLSTTHDLEAIKVEAHAGADAPASAGMNPPDSKRVASPSPRPCSGMARIRSCYGVPAKRGMIVTLSASEGEYVDCLIVGSADDDRLRVKIRDLNGGWSKRTFILHPTWRVTYPQNGHSASTAARAKLTGEE